MPKWRTLSGAEVVAILAEFGFDRHSQKGSHVKLQRVLPSGTRQSLIVPLHKELDRGTLHAIYRQASRLVPEEELKRRMQTD
jgi:predicted RNA binding protein YcfA (HicA-like mRNA interferase family)